MSMLRCLLGLMLGLMLALLTTIAGAQDFAPIPPLKSHVTDVSGMLDSSQRATLENVLKDYEARTGGQIGILLVNSTAPEAIEQYSIRVAEAWKLGRKGVDDGVILVVAKDNPKALRRLRIEAGRGIQGTVTDVQSKRILEDVIAPHFRQNDFYGGLTAGMAALTRLMDQEHLPAPADAGKRAAAAPDDLGIFGYLPFLFIFGIIGILAWRMRDARRNSLHSNSWGRNSSGVMLGSGIGSGIGGGFSSGDSGGGFSGGGGGFDGGGASGDW